MNKKRTLEMALFLLVIALVTVMCANGGGEEQPQSTAPLTAQLTEISGEVKVLKQLDGIFKDAIANVQIEEQDQVLTGEDGRVRMDLSNGTIIRLSPLSNFTLTGIEDTPEGPLTRLQLNIGRLWIILRGGVVEVDTPSGLASVRGSYLHVWVDPVTDQAGVTCLEGICTLGNGGGTIALVAGQSAMIEGAFNPPVADRMDDADVSEWLEGNPEATLVVVPLTQTVAAYEGQPLPESKTNTPTPTASVTNTPNPSYTATITGTPADCGPPEGWVLHTVKAEEDSLESIAALYRVEVSALQQANCRGDMTFVTTGEKLYVPNVATSTPTKTPTPTPTQTPTPIASSTPNWTKTVAAGGATATPSNSATVFSNPAGPDRMIITNDTTVERNTTCENAYKITATDSNGISDVKLIWTFDGSLPVRDTAIDDGYYKLLPKISTDRYGVSDYMIDTTGETPTVDIRFRFTVLDDDGYVSYYPKTDAYDLEDTIGCAPVDTPTTFNSQSGPTGTLTVCEQNYAVNATDPDGIVEVKMIYTLDGTNPNYSTAVSQGKYVLMSDAGGGAYEANNIVINTESMTPPVTVKYRFSVKDAFGTIKVSPVPVDSYSDSLECGQSTGINFVTPVAPLTSPATCEQTYSVDVTDTDGVQSVKVFYSLTDAISATDSGSFPLSLVSGDAYSGTYSVAKAIDTIGFAPTITVDYEFKVKDVLGNWVTVSSMYSFTDDQTCTPP